MASLWSRLQWRTLKEKPDAKTATRVRARNLTCVLLEVYIDAANRMPAMSNLTKDLRRQQKLRRANPIPPPPKRSWDPFPTILIPKGKGRYDSTECAVECSYHPGTMERATRVKASLAKR